MNSTDYIVTKHDNSYDVWRDGLTEPYRTKLVPRECNCPHWLYRLRHSGGTCKHHRLIKEKERTGSVL